MSWPQIREQAAAILSGVEGAGVVHQYQRWAGTWEKFLDLYKTDGAINGGCITRIRIEEPEDTTSHNRTRHFIMIRYFRGLKDDAASEIENDVFIDAVRAEFKTKYKLNDTCYNSTPLQVPVSEPRMFGGVLCHYTEMTLIAEEIEAWS